MQSLLRLPALATPDGRAPCVLLPDWPAIAGVRALFTTRQGGYSAAPCDSWNLGEHVQDEPRHVQANRDLLHAVIGQLHAPAPAHAQPRPAPQPHYLQQIHGCDVWALEGGAPGSAAALPQADAVWTASPGQVCTILVADCLPVLWAHRQAPVVAATHAGWRGLAGQDGGGVLEHTFAAFAQAVRRWLQAHNRPDADADERAIARHTQVWLGPCIGPQAFEVGDEVRQAFAAPAPAQHVTTQHVTIQRATAQSSEDWGRPDWGDIPLWRPSPQHPQRWLAHLPGLARQRLAQLGITQVYGNDGARPWCTFSQETLFFSHRRDSARLGRTGRMAACIWLE